MIATVPRAIVQISAYPNSAPACIVNTICPRSTKPPSAVMMPSVSCRIFFTALRARARRGRASHQLARRADQWGEDVRGLGRPRWVVTRRQEERRQDLEQNDEGEDGAGEDRDLRHEARAAGHQIVLRARCGGRPNGPPRNACGRGGAEGDP